jgi:hypothetical protein
MRELLKDKTALIVIGVAVTAVAVSIAVTGGDLAAYGEYLLRLFGN